MLEKNTPKAATIIDRMEYKRAVNLTIFINKIGLETIEEYEKWLITMYVQMNMCAREICDLHFKNGYSISTRQIQRYLKKLGVSRTGPDAFRLEVKKGNVNYERKARVEKSKDPLW